MGEVAPLPRTPSMHGDGLDLISPKVRAPWLRPHLPRHLAHGVHEPPRLEHSMCYGSAEVPSKGDLVLHLSCVSGQLQYQQGKTPVAGLTN